MNTRTFSLVKRERECYPFTFLLGGIQKLYSYVSFENLKPALVTYAAEPYQP